MGLLGFEGEIREKKESKREKRCKGGRMGKG